MGSRLWSGRSNRLWAIPEGGRGEAIHSFMVKCHPSEVGSRGVPPLLPLAVERGGQGPAPQQDLEKGDQDG